jgi:hypothetical protein
VKSLGALSLAPDGAGFSASWSPYGGPEACFGFYKLVVSTTDDTPSYLDGASSVWVGDSAGMDAAVVDPIDPGTYHVRLEAFFDGPSGKILVAETDVADITIP